MKGFLLILSIVLFFAFLYYWWKKRSARIAAGADYKNDDNYKNTSLIKKMIGWGCLISFIGAVAAPIPDQDQTRPRTKQTTTKEVEQIPLTEEQKAAAELQKKYDDQAKYEEWIAWQKSEEEKKAAAELQKKYDDQAKYEEWIAWKKSQEEEENQKNAKRIANIEKNLSDGWDMTNQQVNQKNFQKAADIIAHQTSYVESANADYPSWDDVYRSPWKYYGKIVCFYGQVGTIIQETPEQSLAKYFGGDYFYTRMGRGNAGGPYLNIHIKGRADNISDGQYITVKGLVVGFRGGDIDFIGIVAQ